MKVLHVVHQSLPHSHVGYCVRTDAMVKGLRALGVEIEIATSLGFPGRSTQRVYEERHDSIRYYRMGIPRVYWIPRALSQLKKQGWRARADLEVKYAARALSEILDRSQPDLIHVHSPGRLMRAVASARGERPIPAIYEARGLWFETLIAEGGLERDGDRHRMLVDEERAALDDADRIVAIAQALRKEFIRWGIPAEKLSVVPNGVDPGNFKPLQKDRKLADTLGLAGSCVAGYITSVRSIEGLDTLLLAVREARAAGTPIKALIVGDGADLPRLRRLATECGVDDAAVFPGRVPHRDIARYYSLIDLFVVPRIDAPVTRLVTPLKPYEAMAMERTVLVSRLPALLEMVTEEKTGYTFPPGGVSELAALLTVLCADPALRAAIGKRARDFVVRERNWTHLSEKYLALYRELTSGSVR